MSSSAPVATTSPPSPGGRAHSGDRQSLPKEGRRAAGPARPRSPAASRDVTRDRRHAPSLPPHPSHPPWQGGGCGAGWWAGRLSGDELPQGLKSLAHTLEFSGK